MKKMKIMRAAHDVAALLAAAWLLWGVALGVAVEWQRLRGEAAQAKEVTE